MPLPGDPSGMTSGLGIYVSTVLGLPNLGERRQARECLRKASDSSITRSASIGSGRHAIGIMVVSVGTSEKPVDVEISGNTIRDSHAQGYQCHANRRTSARSKSNTIVTRAWLHWPPHAAFSSGIHCGGTGSYVIAHNRIELADPNSAGIRIRGYPALGLR